ncbi:DUF3105 domain-containing protein [Naasia lichenicola]|uniref:DUF3105 domain-containing protein n=2 Tax=Naasia lichenicola TaxID=2565933 RepID=A0A4S4FIZ7_9MICO|nr:DUF3105 domain-containing protein [Naasia lichenicola]
MGNGGREARRTEKVERFKREQAAKARRRRFGIIGAIAGAVALATIVVIAVVLTPPAADPADAALEGVQTFTNASTHVTDAVDYAQSPPAGGPHNPIWLNCGAYSQQVPDENAVHSMEHGAVWLTYDPDALSDDELSSLLQLVPATYAIISPYPGMSTPVAISAWNAQLKLDTVDADRIDAFIETYWQSGDAPEPGAACTGGVDGPGRIA